MLLIHLIFSIILKIQLNISRYPKAQKRKLDDQGLVQILHASKVEFSSPNWQQQQQWFYFLLCCCIFYNLGKIVGASIDTLKHFIFRFCHLPKNIKVNSSPKFCNQLFNVFNSQFRHLVISLFWV